MTDRLTTEDLAAPEKHVRDTGFAATDHHPDNQVVEETERYEEVPEGEPYPAADDAVPSPRHDEPRHDEEPLFGADEADGFRDVWRTLQTDFVDDPKGAVRRADELVAEVVQSLATTFAEHKRSLEEQWHEGGQADTEELRLALRRYRAFFDRLLSV
ncbi:hypothetical protein [Saccharothrix obliqua]|uniref:hypothetical protein n=1 Tax=Saccharothrix obliqua TaxID=2861747 RepID=UPI001C5CFE7C|nr:hypothetical protein [Saccharothrix obliqua]MBW4722222.1 hypothetical protein [Saccharothrix obliqua]